MSFNFKDFQESELKDKWFSRNDGTFLMFIEFIMQKTQAKFAYYTWDSAKAQTEIRTTTLSIEEADSFTFEYLWIQRGDIFTYDFHKYRLLLIYFMTDSRSKTRSYFCRCEKFDASGQNLLADRVDLLYHEQVLTEGELL